MKDETEKSKNISKHHSHKCEGKQSSGNLQPTINLLPKYKFQIENYVIIKNNYMFVY